MSTAIPAAYSVGAQDLSEVGAVADVVTAAERRDGADRVARTMPTVIINPASYTVSSCSFQKRRSATYDLRSGVSLSRYKVRGEHADAEPAAAEDNVNCHWYLRASAQVKKC